MKKRLFCFFGIFLTFSLITVFGVSILFTITVLKRKNSVDYGTMNASAVSDDDLRLYSKKILQKQNSHKWVVLAHSYASDHSQMSVYADEYYAHGYNIIEPDNRAHGISEGKYIGMGYLDSKDILKWVEYIGTIDPDSEIVLHGVSMGAGALMILSSSQDVPINVKAIIEDSGYKSAESYLERKIHQRFSMPAFPIVSITNVLSKLIAGFYIKDASAIDSVKYSRFPIMFIHGTADKTIPVSDVYELFNAAQCDKEIYVLEGAEHGSVIYANQKQYWYRVGSFLNNYINF